MKIISMLKLMLVLGCAYCGAKNPGVTSLHAPCSGVVTLGARASILIHCEMQNENFFVELRHINHCAIDKTTGDPVIKNELLGMCHESKKKEAASWPCPMLSIAR